MDGSVEFPTSESNDDSAMFANAYEEVTTN